MSKGYVYVLSNPSMPGLLKVGRSAHGGSRRAEQLYRTGVPAEFRLEFEILTDNARHLESVVHSGLTPFRAGQDREFFTCSIAEAVKCIVDSFLHTHASGFKGITAFALNSQRRHKLFRTENQEDQEPPASRDVVRAHLSELRQMLGDAK